LLTLELLNRVVAAVGVVLLVGYAPFMEEDQLKLFSKIKRGEWRFHAPDWKHISEDAKDLIRGLMVIDPVERMTVDEALRSPWIMQNDSSLSLHDLGGSISNLMSKRETLRSVAKTVVWFGKNTNATGSTADCIQEAGEEETSAGVEEVSMVLEAVQMDVEQS
jgi:calcium/calmodulin-dependent serine protein kinase